MTITYIILFACIYLIMHNFISISFFRCIASFSGSREKQRNAEKKLSIIIPAYNEEKNIGAKLNNIKSGIEQLPKELSCEVLIGSDGSSDETVNITKTFIETNKLPNWKVFDFPNEGKGQTINKLVAASISDLIISSDVDVLPESHSFKLIFESFNDDSQLGCLSCYPVFKQQDIKSQTHYWNQDLALRKAESDLGKLIVVTGWLYGFRKQAFIPISRGVMADDLWIPLCVILKGFKSSAHPNLLVPSEKTDEKTEINRRKRVMAGGMDVVLRLFFNIAKRPLLFFIVFSHKINRWLLPVWFSLIIVCVILLIPWSIIVMFIGGITLWIKLGTDKLLRHLTALYSPVSSFYTALKRSDLSRWEHLRK